MTIQVAVNSSGTLDYLPAPIVDPNTGRKRHKVKRKTVVRWRCGDGDLAIVFIQNQSPFQSGDTVLLAAAGQLTPKETTINATGTFEYVVVVKQTGTPPFIVEDPDLEVSDTFIQTAPKKKTAIKKSKKKK